jgi:transcriptional regulator with XRE-family HTH domain
MKYQNIKDTLTLKGISEARLATELGISRQAMNQKLKGVIAFNELEMRYIQKRLRKGFKFLFEVHSATTRED